MRPSKVFSLILLFSANTAAWPWPPSFRELTALAQMDNLLTRRQQNSNDDAPASSDPPRTATPSPGLSAAPSTSVADKSNTQTVSSDTDSNPPSATIETTGSQRTHAASGTITGKPTTSTLASIDPQDPAGGISFISPSTIDPLYYKIGFATPTWVWNYTSLARPPKYIDILATVNPAAGQAGPSPFTLASNLSFAPTQTFIWDTNQFTQSTAELPLGTYTLIIYDADASGGPSAIPTPGYLGAYNQFTFGMYPPQARVDLANPYVCATCNAAGGQMERLTWSLLLGLTGLTMGTFFWRI